MRLNNRQIELLGMATLAVSAFSITYIGLMLIRVAGGCIEKGSCFAL